MIVKIVNFIHRRMLSSSPMYPMRFLSAQPTTADHKNARHAEYAVGYFFYANGWCRAKNKHSHSILVDKTVPSWKSQSSFGCRLACAN